MGGVMVISSEIDDFTLNLTNPNAGGASTGVSRCLEKVIPGVHFNGSGWIALGE